MFLESIFGTIPVKHGFQLWSAATQRAIWVENFDDADDYLEAYAGSELQVSVALWQTSVHMDTYDEQLPFDEISEVPGFAARFAKINFERRTFDWNDQANLIAEIGQPSIVVNTGDALECVWRFDNPLKIRSPEMAADMVRAYQAFIASVAVAARIHSWELQGTDSFPFWLHLPGTVNADDPPERVKSVYSIEKRHSIEDLISFAVGGEEVETVETIVEPTPMPDLPDKANRTELDVVNETIGSNIRRVVMYKGDVPDFDLHIWDPYDSRIRVISLKVRDVMKLQLFRERMAPYMEQQIGISTQRDWEAMAQLIFQSAERLDMGDQETASERFKSLCLQYVKANPVGNRQPKQTGVMEVENYGPWIDGNTPHHIVLHIPSMIRWLNQSIPNHGFQQREMYRACHALKGRPFSTRSNRTQGARYRGWKLLMSEIGMK